MSVTISPDTRTLVEQWDTVTALSAARNKCADAEYLTLLSEKDDIEVSMAVAIHPNTPSDILNNLAIHPNSSQNYGVSGLFRVF